MSRPAERRRPDRKKRSASISEQITPAEVWKPCKVCVGRVKHATMLNRQCCQMSVGGEAGCGSRLPQERGGKIPVARQRIDDAGTWLAHPRGNVVERIVHAKGRSNDPRVGQDADESETYHSRLPHRLRAGEFFIPPGPHLFVISGFPVDGVNGDVDINNNHRFNPDLAMSSISSDIWPSFSGSMPGRNLTPVLQYDKAPDRVGPRWLPRRPARLH